MEAGLSSFGAVASALVLPAWFGAIWGALPAASGTDAPLRVVQRIEGHAAARTRSPDTAIVLGETGARLDEHLTRLVPFGFSGTVLVQRHDTVLLHEAYGWADRAAGRPVTLDSPFMIGSLTKQFTAAAVVALEEDGHLSVNDSLSKWLPWVPGDKRDITLHQLLTHTSGLPYHTDRDFLERRPRDSIFREMAALPLQFGPGTDWSYSNPGYTLLAAVIQRASGRTYEEYLTERLFRPAGLVSTSFESDRSGIDPGGAVHSYVGPRPFAVDQGPLTDFPPTPKGVGAGTVITTVGDLHRWERALLEGRVLSEEGVTRLFEPHVWWREHAGYGYGWEIRRTVRGTRLVRHMGDIGGYSAEFRRYVDEEVTLILTSAVRVGGRGMREAVLNPVSRIVAGEVVDPPPAVLDGPAGERPVGRFSSGDEAVEISPTSRGIAVSMRSPGALRIAFGEEWSGVELDSLLALPAEERPSLELLLESGGTGWVGFDLFTGRVVRLTPEADGIRLGSSEVGAPVLRLSGPAEPVDSGTVSTGERSRVAVPRTGA